LARSPGAVSAFLNRGAGDGARSGGALRYKKEAAVAGGFSI